MRNIKQAIISVDISNELEVPGHVVAYMTKTRAEWIAQARQAMADAEKYGASCPNEMRDREKAMLRDALRAIGQNPAF